jgi:hypothetical protein
MRFDKYSLKIVLGKGVKWEYPSWGNLTLNRSPFFKLKLNS